MFKVQLTIGNGKTAKKVPVTEVERSDILTEIILK